MLLALEVVAEIAPPPVLQLPQNAMSPPVLAKEIFPVLINDPTDKTALETVILACALLPDRHPVRAATLTSILPAPALRTIAGEVPALDTTPLPPSKLTAPALVGLNFTAPELAFIRDPVEKATVRAELGRLL